MADEITYENRSKSGSTRLYALLRVGRTVVDRATSALVAIETWSDAKARASALAVSDVGRPGWFQADFVEGVAANRVHVSIYEAPGDPYTTATATDALLATLPPIDWDGEAEVIGYADVREVNGIAAVTADPGVFRLAISPIVANTANPRYAVRDLAPVPQGSGPTDYWTIVDGAGAPISLAGKTVRFVVFTVTAAGKACDATDDQVLPLYQYESGSGSHVVIGGAGNNQALVTHDPTKTITPGHYSYELWNATDNLLIAKGKFDVFPTARQAA